jgi:hypothetical protein
MIPCPVCRRIISDRAPKCSHCGRPRDGQLSVATSPGLDAQPNLGTAGHEPPLFQVATHKFVVLSLCSFGLYELYWWYQNWKCLKAATGEGLSPFWRTFFAPFWAYSLFQRIRALAEKRGVDAGYHPGVLATAYVVSSLLWRLPDPWWLLSLASIGALIPVQQTAERLNGVHPSSRAVATNDNYTVANLATILIGGALVLLSVVGTFLPE